MIDPVRSVFDMTKEHRDIALLSSFMPFAMDLEPLIGAYLTLADVVAYFLVKYLRPTSWHRIHTVFYHKIEDFIVAFVILFCQEVHLRSRKRFYMDMRESCFDLFEDIKIPLKPCVWVVS